MHQHLFINFVIKILDFHRFLCCCTSPVATLVLLLKMPFLSLSNIGHIDAWILFAHWTIALIPISNLLPSSLSNDNSDCLGEITTTNIMLYTSFLAYISKSCWVSHCLSKISSMNIILLQLFALTHTLQFSLLLLPLLFSVIFQAHSPHSCYNTHHKTWIRCGQTSNAKKFDNHSFLPFFIYDNPSFLH